MPEVLNPIATMDGEISPQRREALERLFSKIGMSIDFPKASADIIARVNNPNTTTAELTDAIKAEPVLTAKILSQVNSSHYGLAHQVDDLSHAISLLGPKEIRTLAQTLNCAPLFSEKDEHPSFSRKELWRHCVVVGQIAQHIGELIGHGEPGVFYTAGVLHDLGWALMDQSLKRHFHQVLEQIESGAERSAAEVDVFTFDHTQLGAFVSEKWNLPGVVTAAIQHHHDPAGYAGDHQAVVNGVAIANYFADQNGASSLRSATVTFPGDDVFLAIGLGAKQSQSILEEMPSLIEKANQLSSNAGAS